MLSNMDNTSMCDGLPDKVDEKDEVSVYSDQSASSFLQPNAITQKRVSTFFFFNLRSITSA